MVTPVGLYYNVGDEIRIIRNIRFSPHDKWIPGGKLKKSILKVLLFYTTPHFE